MEIIEVNHGIANNFGDYIEINKHLKTEYPKLYNAILQHELNHTDKKGFVKKDFILDLTDNTVSYKELLVFIIRHPTALMQLSPFLKSKNKWFFDLNMIIVYSSLILIIGLAIGFSFLI